MSLVSELMLRLKEAEGDTQAQAVVAAEFALLASPAAERESLRAALHAAAVLRWFDVPLLAAVLGSSQDEARRWFEKLTQFSFVERFPARGHEGHNVHEVTRLGWRRHLAREQLSVFRAVSARAAACFESDSTPAGRIEWIYHLLCSDPERGASELEKLDRDWSSKARPEDQYALCRRPQGTCGNRNRRAPGAPLGAPCHWLDPHAAGGRRATA